jgi:adenylate cyclase
VQKNILLAWAFTESTIEAKTSLVIGVGAFVTRSRYVALILLSFGLKLKYSTPKAFRSSSSVTHFVGIASWVPLTNALKS